MSTTGAWPFLAALIKADSPSCKQRGQVKACVRGRARVVLVVVPGGGLVSGPPHLVLRVHVGVSREKLLHHRLVAVLGSEDQGREPELWERGG